MSLPRALLLVPLLTACPRPVDAPVDDDPSDETEPVETDTTDTEPPGDTDAPPPYACSPRATTHAAWTSATLPTASEPAWTSTPTRPALAATSDADALRLDCAPDLPTSGWGEQAPGVHGYTLPLPEGLGAGATLRLTVSGPLAEEPCGDQPARAGLFVTDGERALALVIERHGSGGDTSIHMIDLNAPELDATTRHVPVAWTDGSELALELTFGTAAIAFVDGVGLDLYNWPTLTARTPSVAPEPTVGLLAFGGTSAFSSFRVDVACGGEGLDLSGDYCLNLHADISFDVRIDQEASGAFEMRGDTYLGAIQGGGTVRGGVAEDVAWHLGDDPTTHDDPPPILEISWADGTLARAEGGYLDGYLIFSARIDEDWHGGTLQPGRCAACPPSTVTDAQLAGALGVPFLEDAPVTVPSTFGAAHPGVEIGPLPDEEGEILHLPGAVCHGCGLLPVTAMADGCVSFAGRRWRLEEGERRWENQLWIELNDRYRLEYVFRVQPEDWSDYDPQDDLSRAQRERILAHVETGRAVRAGDVVADLVLTAPEHLQLAEGPTGLDVRLYDADAGGYVCPADLLSEDARAELEVLAGRGLCESPVCGLSPVPAVSWSALEGRAPDADQPAWVVVDPGASTTLVHDGVPPVLEVGCRSGDAPAGYALLVPEAVTDDVGIEIQGTPEAACGDAPSHGLAVAVSDGDRQVGASLQVEDGATSLVLIDGGTEVVIDGPVPVAWSPWHVLRLRLDRSDDRVRASIHAPDGTTDAELSASWSDRDTSRADWFEPAVMVLGERGSFRVSRIGTGTCP